jgi:hypothetical protein
MGNKSSNSNHGNNSNGNSANNSGGSGGSGGSGTNSSGGDRTVEDVLWAVKVAVLRKVTEDSKAKEAKFRPKDWLGRDAPTFTKK